MPESTPNLRGDDPKGARPGLLNDGSGLTDRVMLGGGGSPSSPRPRVDARPSEDLFHHKSLSEGVHYVVGKGGCWEWQGQLDGKGYGWSGPHLWKVHPLAHRASFILAGGVIEPGMPLHHRCENKRCVNPAHLESATHSDHLTAHHQFASALSWDDLREIRRIHGEGGTNIFELAERYRVSKSEIDNIVRNIKWVDPDYTPGRLAECDECGETFTATRSHQRFCCPYHQRRWGSRMTARRANGTPLDAPVRPYPNRKAA